MYQGQIKKLTDKGYGFIKCDQLPRDVFFHIKNCAHGVSFNQLQEGDAVSFDCEENEKGLNALSVSPVTA